jgi:hypothetical protein
MSRIPPTKTFTIEEAVALTLNVYSESLGLAVLDLAAIRHLGMLADCAVSDAGAPQSSLSTLTVTFLIEIEAQAKRRLAEPQPKGWRFRPDQLVGAPTGPAQKFAQSHINVLRPSMWPAGGWGFVCLLRQKGAEPHGSARAENIPLGD